VIGNVRKFFMDKGYGFLVDDAGQSYFFHCTNFLRADAEGDDRKPKLGEPVTFTVSEALAGRKTAIKVRPFEPQADVRASVASGLAALAKGLDTLQSLQRCKALQAEGTLLQ
jgi:cold shock CspA family protein